MKYKNLVCTICTVMGLWGCETVKEAEVSSNDTEENIVFRPPIRHESVKAIDDDQVDPVIFTEKYDVDLLGKLQGLSKDEDIIDAKKRAPFYEKWLQKAGQDKSKDLVYNPSGSSQGEEGDSFLRDNAAPLATVVPKFAHLLQFDYTIDPQVAGSVTIDIINPLNRRELWQVFEQVLWMAGAYCSPDGKLLRILPFTKMPQERRVLTEHDGNANVEVVYFPIRHASSAEIVNNIKPFLTPGATALDLPRQNAILLIEAPGNLPKLRIFIKQLDKKNKAGWPQAVIPCVNIPASHIVKELTSILPVLGFPVTSDNAVSEPGTIHLTSHDRIQVIIASAANAEAINELRRWVGVLDKADVGEQEKVFVYNIENGKAEELNAALSTIFNTSGSSLSAGSTSSGSGTSTKTSTSTSKSSSSSSSTSDEDKTPSVFDVAVNIFADEVHNRFLVRTTPRAYSMIKAVLNRMDSVTPQVLIRVMIAEITLTDELSYGMEFGHKNIRGDIDHIYGTDFDTVTPGTGTGATYWVNQSDDKFAFIEALAGKDNTKVLSTPQILTESHKEAEISIGRDISIKTGETADVSNSTTSNATFQYKETGIILKLTPHITKGGLISIEMDQEVSDIVEKNDANPDIVRSQFKTTLSIRDNGTVIVGGLIKEKETDNFDGVPYLSDIPYIGKLFGTTYQKTERTEQLVLITATIIREDSNLEEMTKRYEEAMSMIKTQSINK